MLAGQAREHGIFVVAGLTERHGERIYNAAVLISPQGVILAKHRKINVLDIAQDLYSIGDSLSVTETELGTIALTICADNFPDSLAFAHSLARMGAQIILSPSAWAMPANHDNSRDPYGALWMGSYTTIARLYDLPVVGVSNVGWIAGGPWSGQKCIGCSLAIGNTGDVAALGSYGEAAEELVCAQISVTPRTVQGTAISGMVASKGYQEARWVTS
jgi:predicted amidohydrolase